MNECSVPRTEGAVVETEIKSPADRGSAVIRKPVTTGENLTMAQDCWKCAQRQGQSGRQPSMNFQKFKLDLAKAEEPNIKLPTCTGSSKKQRVP